MFMSFINGILSSKEFGVTLSLAMSMAFLISHPIMVSKMKFDKIGIFIIASAFWFCRNMNIGQWHQAIIYAALFLCAVIIWVYKIFNSGISEDPFAEVITLPKKISVFAKAHNKNTHNKSIVIELRFPGMPNTTMCSVDYDVGSGTLSLSAFSPNNPNEPSFKVEYLHLNLFNYDEEMCGVRYCLLPSEVWGYFQDNKEKLIGKMIIVADNEPGGLHDMISAELGNDEGQPFIEIFVAKTPVYREYLYEESCAEQVKIMCRKYLLSGGAMEFLAENGEEDT